MCPFFKLNFPTRKCSIFGGLNTSNSKVELSFYLVLFVRITFAQVPVVFYFYFFTVRQLICFVFQLFRNLNQ